MADPLETMIKGVPKGADAAQVHAVINSALSREFALMRKQIDAIDKKLDKLLKQGE